jgi:hypothetical protein
VITNQKRRDNNHEKKTVPCAQTTTTTTTSNFEFTNALDRENYKTVTVHTNNTNEFSNVTNALQERERRQRRLRRRRSSNLCGCNSGNNNNNRTRSVENAGCGCARWHGNVKELREQEGELVVRCPVPSPDLCGVEEPDDDLYVHRQTLGPRILWGLGIGIPRVLMCFHMQSQL